MQLAITMDLFLPFFFSMMCWQIRCIYICVSIPCHMTAFKNKGILYVSQIFLDLSCSLWSNTTNFPSIGIIAIKRQIYMFFFYNCFGASQKITFLKRYYLQLYPWGCTTYTAQQLKRCLVLGGLGVLLVGNGMLVSVFTYI